MPRVASAGVSASGAPPRNGIRAVGSEVSLSLGLVFVLSVARSLLGCLLARAALKGLLACLYPRSLIF